MDRQEQGGLKNNLTRIILLSFAGSIIYGLPYFRLYYYDAYQSIYGLTNVQMGLLGSAYGVLGVASYVLGGILADKFKAKKLLIFSMITTGAGGFLHLFFENYAALIVIYGLWGFTSLLTFWPALMKIVRTQGRDEEQSRAYGIFEGGRGVFNAVHLSVATAIFGIFQANAMPVLGIKLIIVFYSLAPVVVGILFIFMLKEPEVSVEGEKPEKLTVKQVMNVLKMPMIWLVVLLVFCSYTFNMSVYYFTPYASSVIGTSAVVAAIITALQQYVRPFAATGGGFLADKTGKGQIMGGGFVMMGVGTVIMMLAGKAEGQSQIFLIVAACVVIYTGMFSNFGLYFSFLTEGGVSVKVSGLAIGIVSTFGYLPEVIVPLVAGKILDVFPGAKGYYIYFGFMIAMATVGFVLSLLWCRLYGKKAARQ
ncbi:MFS transporter [Salmonella enterica subsp. enterica]|nr:MFS transporter [Salmonella enterica subsp. enterica]EDY2803481.1 MFS transporter [Salmonella enterica subsp. enterica]